MEPLQRKTLNSALGLWVSEAYPRSKGLRGDSLVLRIGLGLNGLMKACLPQTNQGHRIAVRDEGTCGSAPVPRQPLPCEAFSMGMGFSG